MLNTQLVLTSIAAQGTNLILNAAVPADLGQVTLEVRPSLDAPWKAAEALDVPAGGGEVTFTIPKPGDVLFFRLHATSVVAGAGAVSAELNYLIVAPLGASEGDLASPNAGQVSSNAVFHFKGMVDGSDRILITRDGAFWQHAHWGWPDGPVTVNATQWNPQQKNYLTTAGSAKFLPECFSLDSASLERITGRDVVALERTNAALIVYLDDTPVGAGEYEFKIHFHPARPNPPQASAPTTATLKIAAEIDGTDCLRITATEATWEHKHWGPPAKVSLNDMPWSLQQTNVRHNAGTNVFLPAGVDFSTARILSRKGRDLVTMWAEERALWVWFADSPNGDDHYELEIAFGQ
jgi:hypothetical protein